MLAVHRYFWPDTPPYASLLRTICARWVDDGHDVHVISTQPSYKANVRRARQPAAEVIDGIRVTRMSLLPERGRPWRRVANSILFSFRVAAAVARGRYDVVMASTTPPVVLAWLVSVAARARHTKFLYHCMDVHPEIGEISGEFRHPLVKGLLRWLDRSTCERAERVIVLSDDMQSVLQARRVAQRVRFEVINNFEIPDFSTPSDEVQPPPKPAERLRLVFTGNVGRFQGLDDVIRAVAQCPDDVDLVIMGDGSALAALKRLARSQGAHVTFLPHSNVESAHALIETADLCLVSLVPGIARLAYPSKTMTYLSRGRAILAVTEPDTALARQLTATGVGVTVGPGQPRALTELLRHLSSDHTALKALMRKAEDLGPDVFAVEDTLNRWSRLLAEIADGREKVA